MLRAVLLSVRLSVCLFVQCLRTSKTVDFSTLVYKTLIGSPMMNVEPTGRRGRTSTQPQESPAPLQKHSLGGSTVDAPPSKFHQRRGVIPFRRAIPRSVDVSSRTENRNKFLRPSHSTAHSLHQYTVCLPSAAAVFFSLRSKVNLVPSTPLCAWTHDLLRQEHDIYHKI